MREYDVKLKKQSYKNKKVSAIEGRMMNQNKKSLMKPFVRPRDCLNPKRHCMANVVMT